MNYEYIDDAEGLERALDRLATASSLGVDTEAAGYHRYLDRLSLLQVSTPTENLIIDPVALPDLTALGGIFRDPAVEKVFHDADFDLRILHRDQELTIEGLFDTQIAAAFLGERSLGLGAIVEKYVGVSLPKAYQRADWAERPLSEGMKDYAARDTAYLIPLRDRLRAGLEKKGRVSWAQEEFERRARTRWEEPGGDLEGFMRMKGARDLSPRALAILRELYEWREAVGRERDLATFRVLPNAALLALATRAPADRAELGRVPEVPQKLADRHAAELLAAVRRGRNVPEGELPRFPPPRRYPRDPEAEERSERLRAVRAAVAEELDLDPGFLMPRSTLDEVARQNPGSTAELIEVADVRRWQVEALGDALVRALRN